MKRWRPAGLTAASLVFHALLLGGLALRVFGPEPARHPLGSTLIHLQIEPRPLLIDEAPRRASLSPVPETASHPTDLSAPASPAPPADAVNAPPAVAPQPADDLAARIAHGLRTRGPGCMEVALLTQAERQICEERLRQRAEAAAPVHGTGDARRDARFARQGARALAAFEERREVRASERPVCPKAGPVADCGVEISVDIFSSQDGFFPNQRREE